MEDGTRLLPALTEAGFSEYEAEAYTGLLRLRDASVSELADACSVPRSKLYDVLRELADAGYVETYEEGRLRARIADVTPAVEEMRSRSSELRTAAEELEDRWERPRAQHTDISVFETAEAAIGEALTRVADAEQVVQLSTSAARTAAMHEELAAALDRGVTVRIAVTGEPDADTRSDLPETFPSIATEVRWCETNMPFLALIDGSLAVLAVEDEWNGEYGLVIDDSILTSVLHWFFQLQLWEPWDTVYSASVGRSETYVSIRQLIRDIESIRADDGTVRVRVHGVDTHTHATVAIEGEVVDVVYTDVYRGDATFGQQFVQAALELRTDDGTYTVGGYGAVIEDVRAIRMTITDIR